MRHYTRIKYNTRNFFLLKIKFFSKHQTPERSLVLGGTVASKVAHLVTVVTLDVLAAATVGAFPRDVTGLSTAERAG